MKKRSLSLMLVVVMILGMIPVTAMTASASSDTIVGITLSGDGYNVSTGNYYYPDISDGACKLITSSGTAIDCNPGSTQLFIDEAMTIRLTTAPKLEETYYFSIVVWDFTQTQNIANANSSIKIGGFHKGRVLSTKKDSYGDLYINCSITCGDLTGGVSAIGSDVKYDSTWGGYIPDFSTLKCVSVFGKELDPVEVPSSSGEYNYSYYGVTVGGLYKTYNNGSFSDKLTTAPVDDETYYSYINLDSIDGNLYIEEELVDIRISGYDVEFLDSYESDMGFTSKIVYSVTKHKPYVYVGGVKMTDGDYLIQDTTVTTKIKPLGTGYAYYNNGTLTLNNFSYEGDAGYEYGSGYAGIYSEDDLTIDLVGTNTLVRRDENSVAVFVNGAFLTVCGTGKLTVTADLYGFLAETGITVNSGTIVSDSNFISIGSSVGNVVINGGNITSCGYSGIASAYGYVMINDGNINAIGLVEYGIGYHHGSVYIYGGNVTAVGSKGAIYSYGEFIVGDDMNIRASATEDGTLGEYVTADHDSYKKIVVTPFASAFKAGDANLDGLVDSLDYLLVKRHCFKTYTLEGDGFNAANVNGDGDIDSTDYLLVKRICFGTYTVA